MATMMITWRKAGDRQYEAVLNGEVVAAVANTSATGTDNYPWDWYLIGSLDQAALRNGRVNRSGVSDLLRSAKDAIAGIVERVMP